MKVHITRNQTKQLNPITVSVPYCDLNNLLRYEKKYFYNGGIYGWNYDAYMVEGVTIATGYRNMPGKDLPREMISKYEKKAVAILNDGTFDWLEHEKKIKKLLHKFIEEVKTYVKKDN